MVDFGAWLRGLWGWYAERSSPHDMRRLQKELDAKKAEVEKFDPQLRELYERAFRNQLLSEPGVVASHRGGREIRV